MGTSPLFPFSISFKGLKIHHSFDTVTTERVDFRSVRNVAEAAESHPLVKVHGNPLDIIYVRVSNKVFDTCLVSFAYISLIKYMYIYVSRGEIWN